MIQAIGKQTDYILITGDDFVNVTHKDSEFITDEVFGEDGSTIDQCREKAITYVMDHIKEKV